MNENKYEQMWNELKNSLLCDEQIHDDVISLMEELEDLHLEEKEDDNE